MNTAVTAPPALDYSIVIPFYDEQDNVRPLHAAVLATMQPLRTSFELIYVDDGSRDATFSILGSVQAADPRVTIIKLRRNFGQTAALRAGIRQARGRVIVTMDGDLQNDPADIPRLLALIDDGNDLVTGWRKHRRDRLWSRTLPSRIANYLIAMLTGVTVHDNGCSLKAYRAELIKRLPLYSEMHRFIPAMSTTLGASIAEVVVNHHPRRHGRSKYGLSRIGKVLLDMVTVKMLISFAERPLKWFGAAAVPIACCSFVMTTAVFLNWLLGWGQRANMALALVALLLAYLASHLAIVGLLAELILKLRGHEHAAPLGSSLHINRSQQQRSG